MTEDRFDAGAALDLNSAFNRALYVVAGGVTVLAPGGEHTIALNDAAFFADAVTVMAVARGTVVWRWELLPADVDEDRDAPPGIKSTVKLSPAIPTPDGTLLMRCDRVDFPLGSVTPKHTHQGPGIRCLLCGEVVAEIGGETATYRAGGAWLERGPDPVVGRSSATEKTAFVRVMVLPRRLKGQSSFQAWDASEAAKPRAVTYKQFFDEDIEL